MAVEFSTVEIDTVEIDVLGTVTARVDGARANLRGPRHRAVLARLIIARGGLVPVPVLVDDMWAEPPDGAVGAVRTFVSALRRGLEPNRLPRSTPSVLRTDGSGYRLTVPSDAVDAWRFQDAAEAAKTADPEAAIGILDRALKLWRGPAYAEFADEQWARPERARLSALRLDAVESLADARIAAGAHELAVADLDAHVTEHPWRENAWRLLAVGLYKSHRQVDALSVLRRGRTLLADQFGLEVGAPLRQLEIDILRHSEGSDGPPGSAAVGDPNDPNDPSARVWQQTVGAYDVTGGTGSRGRLRSTVELLRVLAITGGSGLQTARAGRLEAIRAAGELEDQELVARTIGGYDVPAIWSISDDEAQARDIVAAAEHALANIPGPGDDTGNEATRARLLTTIALESRGDTTTRGLRAARESVALARKLADPTLTVFALNGLFMQSFSRPGLAATRDAIGGQLIELSTRHELTTYEILGHLVRMQSRAALGDVRGADEHAARADVLADRYESPLVRVFTGLYRALRPALIGASAADQVIAYRAAASSLDSSGLGGSGMPGLTAGLLPLAVLTVRLNDGRFAPTDETIDWGPNAPWVRPLVALANGDRDAARRYLDETLVPPNDHLLEVRWCLTAHAAMLLEDRAAVARIAAILAPAESEVLGAGSAIVTVAPLWKRIRAWHEHVVGSTAQN